MTCRLVGLLLLLSLMVAAAHAQANPTPAQCAAAIVAVDGRPIPALTDTTFIRWYVLAGCGTTGESAFAKALTTSSVLGEVDAARILELFQLFHARRTGKLFSGFQAAARDPRASQVLAIQVLRSLGALHLPGVDFDSNALTDLTASRCGITLRTVTPVGAVSDLPSDYLTRMVATMAAVEGDANRPAAVRGLAHCWRITLERDVPPDEKAIKLKHVCARKFSVENGNAARVTVSVDVEGTPEKHSFAVAGRASTEFEVFADGHVRLFLNGHQIDKKNTAANKCPP